MLQLRVLKQFTDQFTDFKCKVTIGPKKNNRFILKAFLSIFFLKRLGYFLDQVGAVFLGHLISFSGRAEIEAKYRTYMCHHPPPQKKKKEERKQKKRKNTCPSCFLMIFFFFYNLFFLVHALYKGF